MVGIGSNSSILLFKCIQESEGIENRLQLGKTEPRAIAPKSGFSSSQRTFCTLCKIGSVALPCLPISLKCW